MDDELFQVDPDALTTRRVAVETAQDPPSGPENEQFSDAAYIRLDGVRPDDFTQEERSDLLSTITTELLINYESGIEDIEMLDQDVSVIEIHENVD